MKVGERWRRRDRVIMTIYRVMEGIDHPIVALSPDNRVFRYTEDGYLNSKELPHDHDLIGYTEMEE